ncbi:MAG TPA: hypothetical protein VGQ53_25450 [Chitinophagaceae bacterium]|jgi:hypothetical protein|nr:hypothetical protein [Chitinophagaceae bacterium]
MSEDSIKQAYENAKATLIDKNGNPTPNYQAYMKYEEEWKGKKEAYNTAYAKAMANASQLQRWPNEGVLYQHEVEGAWDRWLTLGFKMEIENAISILGASRSIDPEIENVIKKSRSQ